MLGDPTLAARLRAQLRVPVIAGPMFIGSSPQLVIAQSMAGIVGAMPALNARSTEALDENLAQISEALGPDRLWAINLVAHRSNTRLEADFAVIEKYKVPIVVLALSARSELVQGVHAYGGFIFNDIISEYHARKCAEMGVDGIVAVAAGAGGHTGNVSPFALTSEIREWWQGPLALSGCIATGRHVLAAEAMGADFGYIGSPFLATDEANTSVEQKEMIVACSSRDIVITNCFTGVNATFMRPSIEAHGLDPAAMKRPEGMAVDISGGGADARAWRDIWSAGQGIGAVKQAGPAAEYIEKLVGEYQAAKAALCAR